MEPELPIAKQEAREEVVERKPKTEIRKPKKTKRVEDVDPILLRKRMRQIYKAVVNYQVSRFTVLPAVLSQRHTWRFYTLIAANLITSENRERISPLIDADTLGDF